jgi:hypothetical protein
MITRMITMLHIFLIDLFNIVKYENVDQEIVYSFGQIY